MPNRARLDAILTPGRVLTEDDVEALLLNPPADSVLRQLRLDIRDAAICEAAGFCEGKSRNAKARVVSRYLDRELMGRDTPQPKLYARIARLNLRAPLRVSQVREVLGGGRSNVRKNG